MKNRKEEGLDFIIDKLTHSIENVVSGDSFQTEVSVISNSDLKSISANNNWVFDWKEECRHPERDVYKLTITNNQMIVQGLISIEVRQDHVFIHLIESAPFNKGKTKLYSGVAGNLVAFACKLSFQRGFEGNVSFLSKSRLVLHYIETLGAMHIGSQIMVLNTTASLILINKYFGRK